MLIDFYKRHSLTGKFVSFALKAEVKHPSCKSFLFAQHKDCWCILNFVFSLKNKIVIKCGFLKI